MAGGFEIKIEMPGLEPIIKRFSNFPSRLIARTQQLAARAGQEAAGEARREFAGNVQGDVPGRWGLRPHVRTGRLRQSISTTAEAQGDDYIVKVGSNVRYAPFVDLGTRTARPHPYLTQNFATATERFARGMAAMLREEVEKLKG